MKQVISAFALATCALIAAPDFVAGQGQPTVSVGFSNNSQTSVVIKGYTVVNGSQRPGQLIQIRKGSKGYEANVPSGIRVYNVFDAITFRPLLKDFPVPIQNRDVFLNIISAPNDPTRVIIVPVGLGQ